MAPRLSGWTSIFGVIFKSLLGIERKKETKNNRSYIVLT